MKKTKSIIMKNAKAGISFLLGLVIVLSLFAGIPVTAHAEEGATETIALTPGFYCLHPHKKTPTEFDPIPMTPVPAAEYDGYSQDTLNQVAAAIILQGDFFRETGKNIDNGSLQSVIWAIVCKRSECIMRDGGNLHLNGRDLAKEYYNYVMANYESVIGKYTMTVWKSTIDEYQDILEAKMVEKHSVPSVEKKVMDRNDSESPNFDPVGWQDSADHEIGDTIPFRITASLREMTSFRAYYLRFEDRMTHLTLDPDSLQVTIDGVDKTKDFTVVWDADAKELSVECEDILKLGAKDNSQVVVTYNATLDEDATIGFEGNPNEARLIYSRTTGSADRGITPWDRVVVFTYDAVFNKVTEDGQPLEGATFELFKWIADENGGGAYVSLGEIPTARNEGGSYSAKWTGIDDGKYKIVETVTPVGFNTMAPLEFTVSALHDHLSEEPQLYYLNSDYAFANSTHYYVDEEGNYIEDKENNFIYDGTINANIVNMAGSVLPETGGIGTYPLYLAAAVMMLAAVVALLKKRRA